MDCVGAGRKALEWSFAHSAAVENQNTAPRAPDFLRDPLGESPGRLALHLEVRRKHDQTGKRLDPSDGKFCEIIVGGDSDPTVSKSPSRLLSITQTRPVFDRPEHVEPEFAQSEYKTARAAFVREQSEVVQAAIRPSWRM